MYIQIREEVNVNPWMYGAWVGLEAGLRTSAGVQQAVVAGDITVTHREVGAQASQKYQAAPRAARHGPSRPMRPCLTHRLACALNEVKGSCGR